MKWTIPGNLESVYRKWRNQKKEWQWFYAWLSNQKLRPTFDRDQAKKILREFGHPRPLIWGLIVPPPPQLKKSLDAFIGIALVKSCEEVEQVVILQRKEIDTLQQQNRELREKLERQQRELENVQQQTKCEELKQVLEEHKDDIPPPPPPPMITSQEEEEVVKTNNDAQAALLAAIRAGPEKPLKQTRDDDWKKGFADTLSKRRKDIVPDDDDDDWETEANIERFTYHCDDCGAIIFGSTMEAFQELDAHITKHNTQT